MVSEQWVRNSISAERISLGFGDLLFNEQEKIHQLADWLDLLFQNADGHGRSEVEIQVGPIDPSHIIHTIQYWKIDATSNMNTPQ